MKLPDPIGLRNKLQQPLFTSIFTITDPRFCVIVRDDCCVLSYEEQAPQKKDQQTLASSVTWSIDLLRRHHSYWRDKKSVAERCIRSVNTTLFKNNRSGSFVVILFGERQFYCFSAGDVMVHRVQSLDVMLLLKSTEERIGISRSVPSYQFVTAVFEPEDRFVLSSGIKETTILLKAKSTSSIEKLSSYLVTKKNKNAATAILQIV